MIKCSVCGKENEDGVRFCAECGKALLDEPILLDLDQIKVPAAVRTAHIIKVSAKKSGAAQALPETEEQPSAEAAAAAPEEAAQEDGFIALSDQTTAPEQEIPATDPTTQPMKMRNWIPVFVLSLIPCVNIIMLFVWSFSKKTNKSKQSFARLSLIFTAIFLILGVAAFICYVSLFQVNLGDITSTLPF